MAKIKYDVSNVEDQPGFEHVQPGMYIGKVVEINQKDSKSGNGPMLEVIIEPVKDTKGKKLKPKDKKKKIARVYTYVLLEHEPSEWKLKEFINAFKLKPKGQIDTAKLVGQEVQINLKPDTDLDDNYRPRVGKLVALKEGQAGKDEPEPEEPDEDDDDSEDEDDDDTYSQEDLEEQDDDDLRETAEEFDLDPDDFVSSKGKGKKKKDVLDRDALIEAILAEQGDGDEDEDEDDDDSDDDDEYSAEDIDEMDLDELKEVIEEEELDVKVKKGKKARDLDDIRADVKEALDLEDDDADDDDDDSEDEDEDEDVDYTTWSMDDLKKEAGERGLSTKGTKKVLAARIAKDDEDDNPF